MIKQTRFVWLSLLCALLLSGGALAAEYDGYMVRLAEPVALLAEGAGLPEGVEEIYAPEGLFRVTDDALLRELEEAGVLAYAEPDWVVTLDDPPNDPAYTGGLQWELSMLHMEYAWENGINGMDGNGVPVRVGVVDSGVYTAHEDLAGTRLLAGTNYCAEAGTDGRSDVSDSVGHGTFITGILAAAAGNGTGVAGMAPRAEIVPLKCFTAKTGRLSQIVAAIYGGVDDYQCKILNLSLGTSLDAAGQTLADAVAYAEARGVWLVAAVGNNSGGSTGSDPVRYPAGYDTVIGVGAVDRQKAISYFSYQNGSVFAVAPGEGLYGLGIASETAYVTGQGTSYAAPMVSAAAALALSVRPELTRAEFMALLRDTAEDLGEPGYDTVYGYGLLDVGALLEVLSSGWHAYQEDGRQALAFRVRGLAPGSTATAVEALYDANGAQRQIAYHELTVGQDGVLSGKIVLSETASNTRIRVFLLDDARRPLADGWRGT
nr:S8 family serine peptidase [uncultured Oscillibacter sp.]